MIHFVANRTYILNNMVNHVLFDMNDIASLKKQHKILINTMMTERNNPYMDQAVQMNVKLILERKNIIMEDLIQQLRTVPQETEFWVKAVSFYSHKYTVLMRRLEYEKSIHERMYSIWEFTNFRNDLLEELGLDPTMFRLEMVSEYICQIGEGISEYYNTIMIIYCPK